MAKAMWPSAQGRRLPLPRWCPASGSCRRLGTAPGGSGRRGAPRGRDRATGSAATASGAVANRLQSRLRFCTWLACRTRAAQPRVVPVTGAGGGEAGGAPCRLQNWLRRGSEGRVGARRRRGCDRTTRQRGFGFGRALYLVDCSPEPPPSLRRFCPSMRIARIEPSAMPAPPPPPRAPTVQVNALRATSLSLRSQVPSTPNFCRGTGDSRPTRSVSSDELPSLKC